MSYGRGYQSWEEFEREEIRPHQRLEMSFEEILAEFDVEENARRKRARSRSQNLFDDYDEADGDYDE